METNPSREARVGVTLLLWLNAGNDGLGGADSWPEIFPASLNQPRVGPEQKMMQLVPGCPPEPEDLGTESLARKSYVNKS